MLPRGSTLATQSVDNVACRYRTTAPVTLWPIRIADAKWQPPPFPAGIAAPPRAAALLRIKFEASGPLRFHQLETEQLRIHLHSDQAWLSLLYEMLFNHAIIATYRATEPGSRARPFSLAPSRCLSQVGFDPGDELVPYPPRAPLGYRLLTEYFTYPPKFLFADLGGWQRVAKAGFEGTCEVNIFFDRTHKFLEQGVDRSTFRLGCVPVVNLFPHVIQQIPIESPRTTYPLVPDPAFPRAYEIYSVDAVSSRDPATNETTTYPPFHSIDHDLAAEEATAHWYPTRTSSLDVGERATDVELNFVDLGFKPLVPDRPFVTVAMTCTNRDLPDLLAALGPELRFQLETAAPLQGITVIRPPTTPLRPGQRRGWAWKLISHLNLNSLSLTGGDEGLEAFRDLFRLYDYSDPDAGQAQLTNVALGVADGILDVQSRRVIGQLEESGTALFCRGVEATIELDEDKFPGVYLFASVLERFLGLYVSTNSFTELIVKTRQRGGVVKRWPPRPGQLPTL